LIHGISIVKIHRVSSVSIEFPWNFSGTIEFPLNFLGPARTEELVASLERVGFQWPLYLVSRLDQPTSGVLPLALGGDGSTAVNWLQAQFAGRLVEKDMADMGQWAMGVGNLMEVHTHETNCNTIR
jgi:hypothetical protein